MFSVRLIPARAAMRASFVLAAALAGGAFAAHAASTDAIQYPSGGVLTANSWNMQSETDGWIFSVNQTINVTSLGMFDSGQDGLADPHELGLWSTPSLTSYSGTLLSSVTIPAGTTTTLSGPFRYTSITPVTLNPGTFYVIGAHYAGQPGSGGGSIDPTPSTQDGHLSEYYSSGEVIASAINFLGPRVSGQQTTGLQFPGQNMPGSYPELGPSFQFEAAQTQTASVPDSLPVAATSAALLGVVAIDRFRRRRRAAA